MPVSIALIVDSRFLTRVKEMYETAILVLDMVPIQI